MSSISDSAEEKKPSLFFKSSKLSSVANELWSKSKESWRPATTSVSLSFVKAGLKTEGENDDKTLSQSVFSGGHVFGSKIAEKKEQVDQKASEEETTSTTSSIFKKFADTTQKKENEETAECSSSSTNKESLEESVKAYIKQKKDEEGPVSGETNITTGEEDEVNIYQVTGKLHFFDTEQKVWVERGMCNFRINRKTEQRSHRFVCRALGNQRVIINSAFFKNMIIEKISNRRMKFSACCPDHELPQLFLFQASDASMEKLYELFHNLYTLHKFSEQNPRKRKAESDEDDEENAKRAAAVAEAEKELGSNEAVDPTESDESNDSLAKSDECEIVKRASTSDED